MLQSCLVVLQLQLCWAYFCMRLLRSQQGLQDPYGWDAFKEAPSQAAARRESLDTWDHPRPYTEDAVDRMLSTSGARSAGREQRAKAGSAVSKELFSPTAMM